MRKCLGKRGLAVFQVAGKQNTMPGSQIVRTKQVGPMMFFDQFRARLLHGLRQNQLFKGTLRDDFIEEFPARPRCRSSPAHPLAGESFRCG